MDPEKLEKLATLVTQHWGYFAKITVPFVVIVSGLIVWLYQQFFMASLREDNARWKERNDRLEKERDALKNDIKETRARNAELTNFLIASTDSERQKERKVEELLSQLSQFRVSGKNEVSLSSFFTDRCSRIDGGLLLFDGKLALPPLNTKWIQVSHGDGGEGTFKGGDLGIFQRMTSVSWQSIERSLRRTLDFNEKHPPNIWTTELVGDDEEDGSFFPYIQVSLISHTEATLLMRSVREDIEEMGQKVQSDLKEILERLRFEYHPHEVEIETEGKSTMSKWAVFFEKLSKDWKTNTTEKLQRLIDAILPEGDRLTFSALDYQQLESVIPELIETVQLYAAYPLLMLNNCVGSLGKMPPETGLLIGRLLYYVFGVAKGGKVDIQQLSSSYEGAYGRIRTEAEPSANGKASLVTNDYILILATKSDFCLVHVHIPLHSSQMWGLDIEAQNWIKNIRMALLK